MDENYPNHMQDKRIERLEENVKEIKDNHLFHISNHLVQVGTDIDWLKRFFWIVATTSIGGVIAAILNVIITLKK